MSSATKILIVDDDPADVRIAGRVLRAAGTDRFVLRSAGMMSEAIATLESAMIDLVVLDLGLPDVQGLQTVEALTPYLAGTPVIVLTGVEDHHVGTACLEAGADDFLPKSRVVGELLRVVEFALRRRSLLARRFGELSKILVETAVDASTEIGQAHTLLVDQLPQIERELLTPTEHDAAARRVRALASKLAALEMPPAMLLERAMNSPRVVTGPGAGAILLVATELGQVYFDQSRSKKNEAQ